MALCNMDGRQNNIEPITFYELSINKFMDELQSTVLPLYQGMHKSSRP